MTIKYNNDAGHAGASENARPRSINRSGSACDHAHSLRIIDAAERLHATTSHAGGINLGLLAEALAQNEGTNPAMPESFASSTWRLLASTPVSTKSFKSQQSAATPILRMVETIKLRCDLLEWQVPSPEPSDYNEPSPYQLSGTGREFL